MKKLLLLSPFLLFLYCGATNSNEKTESTGEDPFVTDYRSQIVQTDGVPKGALQVIEDSRRASLAKHDQRHRDFERIKRELYAYHKPVISYICTSGEDCLKEIERLQTFLPKDPEAGHLDKTDLLRIHAIELMFQMRYFYLEHERECNLPLEQRFHPERCHADPESVLQDQSS